MSKADRRLFLILMSLIPFIISLTVRCIAQPEPKAKVETVYSLTKDDPEPTIVDGKVSLEDCRRTLNVDGDNFTDEQIIMIRDWLYHMADIAIQEYDRKQELKRNNEV